MRETKRSWQNVLYILILLTAICLLFHWYSSANSQWIELRNLNYAIDSAQQTALRIDSELTNAQRRVRNYAYCLSETLNEPNISTKMLRELEENSDFDALHFTNAAGVNMASDGSITNSLDRSYFTSGMRGESGDSVIFESRMTDETMMVYYAPLRYQGDTFGILMGLYFAEDYLKEMLSTSYFGEEAGVFLCTRDGRVIATSAEGTYDRPLPDHLRDKIGRAHV